MSKIEELAKRYNAAIEELREIKKEETQLLANKEQYEFSLKEEMKSWLLNYIYYNMSVSKGDIEVIKLPFSIADKNFHFVIETSHFAAIVTFNKVFVSYERV